MIQKLKLTIKFLHQNGIEVKQKQNANRICLTAIHHHGEIFSDLLISLITKLFVKTSSVSAINVKDGTFSLNIFKKEFS